MTDRILRRPEVEAITGLARSTIYDRVRNGRFPSPVILGARSVGWRQSDVEAWIATLSAAPTFRTNPHPDTVGSPGVAATNANAHSSR